jgi:predicted outer membrane repeat protein
MSRFLKVVSYVLISFSVLLTLLSSRQVLAADITVGGACTLILAIQEANTSGASAGACTTGTAGSDNVVLAAGTTYTLTTGPYVAQGNNGLPLITSPIVILGNGATITRNSATNFRILYVDTTGNLTLDNVTVSNGIAVNGGGIYNDGILVVRNSRILNNTGTFNAGGIYNVGSNLTVEGGSVFSGNVAQMNDGGGILSERGTVTIDGSTFGGGVPNQSVRGGGIYACACIGASQVTINNTQITNNQVTAYGGGVQFSADRTFPVTITNSTITNNRASVEGGAISVIGGGLAPYAMSLTIDNTLINGNQAVNGGGAIYNYNYARITIQNGTQISQNGAPTGGGIHNGGSSILAISNSVLRENTAATQGGAIYNESTVAQDIISSCIVGNSNVAVFNAMAASINATGNWWGAADGPANGGGSTATGSGDTISGNVAFTPFSSVPIAGCTTVTAPEIAVLDGGVLVPDGTTTAVNVGGTLVGTPITHTLTIDNTAGTAPLTLGIPTLTGDFSIIGAFPITVAAGNVDTFTIQCNATAVGTPVIGTISFATNDSDENPYNFPLACTVTAVPAPEIDVLNGGVLIPDDTTTAVNIGTTLVGTPITRTLTIDNTAGTASLTLGTPTLTGDFSIFGTFPTMIGAGTKDTFTVQCNATAAGTPITGAISFATNDSDENPYNFPLACTVTTVPIPATPVPSQELPKPTPEPGDVFTCDNLAVRSGSSMTAAGTVGNVMRGDTSGNIYCRIIVSNGVFIQTNAEIGQINVIQQPIAQAVDLFGLLPDGSSIVPYLKPVKVCLRGAGTVFFLDAAQSPRSLLRLMSVSEGEYSCVNIVGSGTVILVPGEAQHDAQAVPATTTLTGCQVTTLYRVHLRSEPSVESQIIATLPYKVTWTVTEYAPGWYRVIYLNSQGWVNERYVKSSSSCTS